MVAAHRQLPERARFLPSSAPLRRDTWAHYEIARSKTSTTISVKRAPPRGAPGRPDGLHPLLTLSQGFGPVGAQQQRRCQRIERRRGESVPDQRPRAKQERVRESGIQSQRFAERRLRLQLTIHRQERLAPQELQRSPRLRRVQQLRERMLGSSSASPQQQPLGLALLERGISLRHTETSINMGQRPAQTTFQQEEARKMLVGLFSVREQRRFIEDALSLSQAALLLEERAVAHVRHAARRIATHRAAILLRCGVQVANAFEQLAVREPE